jgi:pentose-5-phosphate-3-epimerase
VPLAPRFDSVTLVVSDVDDTLAPLRTSLAAAAPHCDSIHFDIMDNHFVPEFLFGPDVLAAVKPHVPVPFQAHMMMENPGGRRTESHEGV